MNYGPKQIINRLEFYSHLILGTVVYEDLGNEQIAYVFRGNPCTNFEQVKELLPVCKIKRKIENDKVDICIIQ